MKFKEMEKLIAKADPNLKRDDESFMAQVVLLASLEVGPNIPRLVRFTGYPKQTITKFSHFLRKSKIWRGDKVCANWDGDNGYLALVMDAAVALGWVEKVPEAA